MHKLHPLHVRAVQTLMYGLPTTFCRLMAGNSKFKKKDAGIGEQVQGEKE